MKQHEAVEVVTETPVVKLDANTQKSEKPLLTKRSVNQGKVKGMRF